METKLNKHVFCYTFGIRLDLDYGREKWVKLFFFWLQINVMYRVVQSRTPTVGSESRSCRISGQPGGCHCRWPAARCPVPGWARPGSAARPARSPESGRVTKNTGTFQTLPWDSVETQYPVWKIVFFICVLNINRKINATLCFKCLHLKPSPAIGYTRNNKIKHDRHVHHTFDMQDMMYCISFYTQEIY